MNAALLVVLLAAPPKNLKVLTDLPPAQLIPSMAFIANSLGVTCTHCHVGKTYELDDKPAKETARAHIRMTRAINEQNFGGKLVVTCNSCHQGHVTPIATPLVANAGWNQTAPPKLPDPATILQKAVLPSPLGDTAGTVERFNGREDPVSGEFAIADHKLSTTLSYPPEANNALRTVTLDAFKTWKTIAIDGDAVVLEAIRADVIPSGVEGSGREVKDARPTPPDPSTHARDDIPDRFWFDAKTGALLRRQHTTRTPLGDLPEEIAYTATTRRWSRGDYRVTFTMGGAVRQ